MLKMLVAFKKIHQFVMCRELPNLAFRVATGGARALGVPATDAIKQ
jgi:hypothetical protein